MMEKNLRGYQVQTITEVLSALATADRVVAELPTGTGKSLIQMRLALEVRKNAPEATIHFVTTRNTIVRGYLRELGYDLTGVSARRLQELAESHGIYTYIRYRNLLEAGKICRPSLCIIDEVHHWKKSNASMQSIFFYLREAKVVGFTATFYRATPKSTIELQEEWPVVLRPLKLAEAVEQGYWKLPTHVIRGVIDDDIFAVVNGEFSVRSAQAHFADVKGKTIFSEAANLIQSYQAKFDGPAPTIVAVPSVDIAKNCCEYFCAAGLPSCTITHRSTDMERQAALASLEAGKKVLVQVGILSEGFDLPALRILVDMKPMYSAVEYLQTYGRLTRPCPGEKYYICLNRNLERHHYLLGGLLPSNEVAEMQSAFPEMSSRIKCRSLGVERLGRLQPIDFTRADGLRGAFYCLRKMIGNGDDLRTQQQYAVVLLPDRMEPIVAFRENVFQGAQENFRVQWGKWKRTQMAEGFQGYATVPNKKQASAAQMKWWTKKRQALGLGDYIPDGRQFQILPILEQLGEKI